MNQVASPEYSPELTAAAFVVAAAWVVDVDGVYFAEVLDSTLEVLDSTMEVLDSTLEVLDSSLEVLDSTLDDEVEGLCIVASEYALLKNEKVCSGWEDEAVTMEYEAVTLEDEAVTFEDEAVTLEDEDVTLEDEADALLVSFSKEDSVQLPTLERVQGL